MRRYLVGRGRGFPHLTFLSPLPFLSPSDSDSAPVPQRCACHAAGRPLSGKLLLSGGGAPQQARGGGPVSVFVRVCVCESVFDLGVCYPPSGAAKSCCCSQSSSVVMTRRRFLSRAPSTQSESASLSSRSVRLLIPTCLTCPSVQLTGLILVTFMLYSYLGNTYLFLHHCRYPNRSAEM